jgi:2-hydroxy-3-keto-5-methylthiopentenyl-1-phosphate phosphatase
MDLAKKTLSFGKHMGKSFEDIKSTDISYCNWVLKQMNTRGSMKEFQDWLKQNARKATCEACNGTGIGHTM